MLDDDGEKRELAMKSYLLIVYSRSFRDVADVDVEDVDDVKVK